MKHSRGVDRQCAALNETHPAVKVHCHFRRVKNNPPAPKLNGSLHEMLGQNRRDPVSAGFATNAYPEDCRGVG